MSLIYTARAKRCRPSAEQEPKRCFRRSITACIGARELGSNVPVHRCSCRAGVRLRLRARPSPVEASTSPDAAPPPFRPPPRSCECKAGVWGQPSPRPLPCRKWARRANPGGVCVCFLTAARWGEAAKCSFLQTGNVLE